MRHLEVHSVGALALVEDHGRTGLAHLGVGRSGAADRPSFDLANRLVGNFYGTPGIETTLGGLTLVPDGPVLVAVTGAPLAIRAGRRQQAVGTAFYLRPGEELRLGVPRCGLRTYVAVRGGVVGTTELGSSSWDTMAHLGTPPLGPGSVLAVAEGRDAVPAVALAPLPAWPTGTVELPLVLGPRDGWFTGAAIEVLATAEFTVTPDTDRVGARLAGPPLQRRCTDELASEGVVTGALQVPTDGRPTLFLADHPVTGGYPVIGVVPLHAVAAASQLVPGQTLRFRVRPR